MIDIKLNRRLFAEEEFDDLERLMATYSLCQSKRSGKTFLIATKCKKNTWWYCVYAFIIPFCIGFIMLIPINKWICLLLGIAAASAFVGGLSVMHRNTLKKLQFHPLMVFDPQKRTISFYRFKDVAFFQMSGKVQKFNLKVAVIHHSSTTIVHNSISEQQTLLVQSNFQQVLKWLCLVTTFL